MPGNEKTLKATGRDISTDSGEGKSKNFSVDEDYWIEVGWVQTSEDPIKGTDQNREEFGDSVKKNISDQTSLFNNRTAPLEQKTSRCIGQVQCRICSSKRYCKKWMDKGNVHRSSDSCI